MTEKISKPNWLKTRKDALKGKAQKLFTFPEGTTTVVFDPNLEPEQRKIDTNTKTVYTVTINGESVKFVASKSLERQLVEIFEKNIWVVDVTRSGLNIDDTVYSVSPHKTLKEKP